jgi:ribosomal protein S18 acetylase RimI-like enzyme
VANDAGQPTIVGGGRYVVIQPGQAEVAFAIVDAYQRLGLGSALMRHLATLGREAGLRELIAEVLSENVPMLSVFERSGLAMNTRRRAMSSTLLCATADRQRRSGLRSDRVARCA